MATRYLGRQSIDLLGLAADQFGLRDDQLTKLCLR